jgi:hypothetical protein
MPPIEKYLEHAPELAQEVVNTWGALAQSRASFKPEFSALMDKAHRYRMLTRVVDNHREHNVLTEETDAEQKAAHHEFALAYKIFREKNEPSLALR